MVRLTATVIHALASTTREHGLTPALCQLHILLEMPKQSLISIAMLITTINTINAAILCFVYFQQNKKRAKATARVSGVDFGESFSHEDFHTS
jgi:hypothetical protein